MTNPDPFHDRHMYEDEQAIASAINYFKYKEPENANRDYAIAFLKIHAAICIPGRKTKGLDYDKLYELFKKSETKIKRQTYRQREDRPMEVDPFSPGTTLVTEGCFIGFSA